MSEANLVEALDKIMARLDDLERKVDALGGSRAVDDPEVAGGIDRMLGRIDRMEKSLDAYGTLAAKLPVISDAAASGATWAWKQAEAQGIDPIKTGMRATDLGVAAMHPDSLDLVEQILAPEQRELAKTLLAQAPMLKKLVAAGDSVDEADLDAVLAAAPTLTKTLAKVIAAPEFTTLLEASADPKALATAQYATTALVESRSQPIQGVGMFGVLGKMGDSDVQRAVGFTFALAKRFGQLLDR